jgi:3D (Asp-Asp-Asp) domain-containing protein
MKRSFPIICLALLLCSSVHAQTRCRRPIRIFQATAYAQGNLTASGKDARPGRVAADTHVLPLGTRIEFK